MKYDMKILAITEKFADLYIALDGKPIMQNMIDDEYDRFLNQENLPSIKMHDDYREVYRTRKIQELDGEVE